MKERFILANGKLYRVRIELGVGKYCTTLYVLEKYPPEKTTRTSVVTSAGNPLDAAVALAYHAIEQGKRKFTFYSGDGTPFLGIIEEVRECDAKTAKGK